jgi:hypothetical protein
MTSKGGQERRKVPSSDRKLPEVYENWVAHLAQFNMIALGATVEADWGTEEAQNPHICPSQDML